MASGYAAIRAENIVGYGTRIAKIGQMLLADRYDDRAHFIYELLQNAEDAFARRTGSNAQKSITFQLSSSELRVSHFGAPFTQADVRGICGIAESTKDLNAIGRFGIGFKSVYAFTNRPKIHSGSEHFAIESFVWPCPIEPCGSRPEETVFILPIATGDVAAHDEIAQGLRRLGPRALLFLRHIEEIAWSVEGGASGLYIRSKPDPLGENARRIELIGQQEDPVEESWLVFSRKVYTSEGAAGGFVEIAFALKEEQDDELSVLPIIDSALVVFFPTILPTHLGFLVQGPYRTTPSRDNVPRHDAWNQHLVRETASLLVEALHLLRDAGLLNTSALGSLPLDRAKFGEGQMFSPLYDAVREALSSEPLLPTFGGGHASANHVKLARTQDLRDLVSRTQLAKLFAQSEEIAWLSEEITQDRTPQLRQYLMRELGIAEVTPEVFVQKLSKIFLEDQNDQWILQLYEFLHGQPALLRQGLLNDVPLVRLENGSHVAPSKDGHPRAFLPGSVATDFPTVRRAVCSTKAAGAFLSSLGLTEPDPVDDVIWNVLPKYEADDLDISDEGYEADIARILTAFGTDSKGQRDKLLAALRESSFLIAVDAGTGSQVRSVPTDVYLVTARLKDLFDGVSGVLIVDERYSCLKGEPVRELLEACGATRYLQPVTVDSNFDWQELSEMRRRAGYASSTGGEKIDDYTLRGLNQLLEILPTLTSDQAVKKTTLLWDSLCDVEDRRGARAFMGTYSWYYFQRRSCTFPAGFVRQLNKVAWVPDDKGVLQQAEFVVFDWTGWKANPFLLSRIRFKPPLLESLAREAGLEPGMLDLLKQLGVTSEAELRMRLGITDEPQPPEAKPGQGNVDDALKNILGNAPQPTPPVPDPSGPEPTGAHGAATGRSGTSSGGGSGAYTHSGGSTGGNATTSGTGGGGHTAAQGSGGIRTFVSYLATHPIDEEPDPDGLDQQSRLALEEKAIALIVSLEPELHRTPTNNPGFDLIAADESGTQMKWVEVKAMTGMLQDRPVGMSHTQFDCARQHGDAYWLYIVENAGSTGEARIVRIQNPAGLARTFTFDHGWLSIAEIWRQQRANN